MKGKAKTPKVTHEQIRDALDYNPSTGVFVWKISPAKNIAIGAVAGGNNGRRGYSCVCLNGEEITTSRLAWFYMTGEWPERRVRFKNGDKTDCRFENLTLFDGIGGEFDFKTNEGLRAYQRAYRGKTPLIQKSRALRDSFNLSFDDYMQMFNDQSGACAICHQPETHRRQGKLKALAVDHDHKTGAIRGLLCSDCNTGIGKLKDSPSVLRSAIQYLERPRSIADQTGRADPV